MRAGGSPSRRPRSVASQGGPPAADPAAGPLLALVRTLGGKVDGLVVAASGAERGVYAARPFAAGEVVLAVPPALIVASEAVAATPVGAAIVARWGADADPMLLAAWLADAERRAGPTAAPYLALLPRSLAHLPVSYGEAGRAALAGTAFLDRVDARRARLLEEHAWLVAAAPGFAEQPAEAWLRARALATSRSFSYGPGEALVPIADLLNHALDPGTAWTCDATAGFVVRATRELPAGAELLVSYGDKSNARLLLAYGFTLPDNPTDDMELFLGALGAFRLAPTDATSEAERLLAALGAEDPASRHRALAALADVCGGRLARLPTDTPAERADPALRDALAIRASERRILGWWATHRS